MKFRGDDRELLRGLWSAVEKAGGSPSVNMIQKMARLTGASFDDKTARAILFGDTEVTPQNGSTRIKVTPKRIASKNNNSSIDHSRIDTAELKAQKLTTKTEAALKCGFGENDETMVVDSPAANLFDGLVDPLPLVPVNEAVTRVPASGAAPQEVPAPGIARLMELSKKAKAVNAAAAIRSAAKPPPKGIRYIFPSERKN